MSLIGYATFFFSDAFWKKVFGWIKSGIYERTCGRGKKKILLLAAVLKALLSVVMPEGYKGLKQGPQLSAQHSSPLAEWVG